MRRRPGTARATALATSSTEMSSKDRQPGVWILCRSKPEEEAGDAALTRRTTSDGLPTGVQVVGRGYADVTVLKVASAIERGIGVDHG